MKNAKKVLNGWFWGWLFTALIISLVMLIAGPNHARWLSSLIMALFFLMPMRNWTYRFFEWSIEYVASINAVFKDRVNKWVTTNNLIEPNKRFENVGHYRALQGAVNLVMFIMSLTAIVFKNLSFNIVYSCLHIIECILTGKIKIWMLLIEVLLTIIFIYGVVQFIGKILNESLNNERRFTNNGKIIIILAIMLFYAKIIISGWLLCFTGSMILSRLVFWTIIIAVPVIIVKLVELLSTKISPLDGDDGDSYDDDGYDDL